MGSSLRHALGIVGLVVLAVGGGGCSTTTLTGSSQALDVLFTPNPPGAGRYTGVGNDNATFIINKLTVVPADDATAALLGNVALSFRFSPFDPTNHPKLLTETTESEFSHVALSTGTYRVREFEVTPLVLIDDNVSATPATCIEGIAVIDGSKPPNQVPASFNFSFPTAASTPAGLNFAIRPGQTKLALNVNVPGLIAGYEASYTCQQACAPSGRPCLTAFSTPSFRAAILANITLE